MEAELHIDGLEVENFRRFEKFSLDLERDLTVLTARNGGGKTATCDAIRLILSPLVAGLTGRHESPFHNRDAFRRWRAVTGTADPIWPVRVSASLAIGDRGVEIARRWQGPKSRPRDPGTIELGRELRDAAATSDGALPVVATYGTGRLHVEYSSVDAKRPADTRTAGYLDCLRPGSSLKSASEWLAWADSAGNESADGIGAVTARAIAAAVKRAAADALRPARDEAPLEITFDRTIGALAARRVDGPWVPVGQLSDGERVMVGLTADLARRMATVNPHWGADAVESPGVVVIDEIDMHLHPEWQQHVLTGLRAAFPNVQLIVTTHSPIVVSTVDGRCVRDLEAGDAAEAAAGPETRNRRASDVLRYRFHVAERPPAGEEEVRLLLRSASDDPLDDELDRRLDAAGASLGVDDRDVVTAKRIVRLRRLSAS